MYDLLQKGYQNKQFLTSEAQNKTTAPQKSIKNKTHLSNKKATVDESYNRIVKKFFKLLEANNYFKRNESIPKSYRPTIKSAPPKKSVNYYQPTITKPRISALAKKYKVAHYSIIDFLHSHGYKNIDLYTILDEKTQTLIDSYFQTFREPILHLTTNFFDKPKATITFNGLPPIRTHFTDEQAIGICSKMSSSFTRNLCRQLSNPRENRKKILYQLHYIANKALNIYGGKMLTFIYQLRNLNFKNTTAIEVQTYSKVIPDFPLISFDVGQDSFCISFFAKQIRPNKIIPDIRLFTSRSFEEIGLIDEEGYIFYKLSKFKPRLTLFFESLKEGKFEIRAGVESGYCQRCNRELTHPLSLRIGFGPDCAKMANIDALLYKFI